MTKADPAKIDSAIGAGGDVYHKIAWGVVASLGDRVVGILGSLLLIPILMQSLSAAHVGLWFLLSQPLTLLAVLDLGLTETVTRQFALSRGRIGQPDQRQIATRQLADQLATSRVLYHAVSAIVVVVTLVGVGAMIYVAEDLRMEGATALVIASIVAANHFIRVQTQLYSAMLIAGGSIRTVQTVSMVVQIPSLAAKVVSLWFGYGLVTLLVIDLVAAAMIYRLDRRYASGMISDRGRFDWRIVHRWRPLALRSWLTSLGGFAILRTDQYFIVLCLAAAALPNYQAGLLVLSNLYMLAVLPIRCASPHLSHCWSAGRIEVWRRDWSRLMDLAMATMITGSLTVLLNAPDLFELWLGPGRFVGYPVLMIFAVTVFLEAHHVVFAYGVRSTEVEPFAKPALIAGGLNLSLTALMVFPFGLPGVAAATMISQLATNNWYVVAVGKRRLRIGSAEYLTKHVVPYAMLALVTIGSLVTLTNLSPPTNPSWRLASSVLCGGVLWCLFLAARWGDRVFSHTSLQRLSRKHPAGGIDVQ